MTKQQLADATGTTSVRVNRILQYLGTEGLIQRKMRSIYMIDRQSFKRMAGFNEAWFTGRTLPLFEIGCSHRRVTRGGLTAG